MGTRYFGVLGFIAILAASNCEASIVYQWTGQCETGCIGQATAIITLSDAYVPGSIVGQADSSLLQSFEYASSTGSFVVTPDNLENTRFLFTIDPNITTDSQVVRIGSSPLTFWFLDADRVGGGTEWFANVDGVVQGGGAVLGAGTITVVPIPAAAWLMLGGIGSLPASRLLVRPS
ncbi:MAG: VPLPA-CTERM sorting domain-containing protein [Gammaproteobacteria bacterium]